ncbi:hypothetical protein JB92DRAFT_3038562 [Gautieria morchelliformis]|nr:hypothetical protein JB92DRAFT_3038562 [Gautieria morchelliformis]
MSDNLHGYPLGYLWTCHRERAYVATMLNAQRSVVLTGGTNVASISIPGETIFETASSFIPVWVDMLQAGTPLVAFLIFGTSKVNMVSVVIP